jgi:hypothetical protein
MSEILRLAFDLQTERLAHETTRKKLKETKLAYDILADEDDVLIEELKAELKQFANELWELQDAIVNSLMDSDSLHTINLCVPFGEEAWGELHCAIKASRERAKWDAGTEAS